jgi:hypothetical protein
LGGGGIGVLTGRAFVAAGRRPVREAGDEGAGPHRQGLQRPDARQARLQDGTVCDCTSEYLASYSYIFVDEDHMLEEMHESFELSNFKCLVLHAW